MFEMWRVRRMLRKSWTENVINVEVLVRAGVKRQQFKNPETQTKLFWSYHQTRGIQRERLEGMIGNKISR